MLPAWMINAVKSNEKADLEELGRSDCHVGYGNYRSDIISDVDSDSEEPTTLECGSGGGPPSPPPPDYEAQANAEMKAERERARLAEESRLREEERKAAEEEKKRERFQSSSAGAYNNARNYGVSRLRALGLDNDEYGILPAYYSELDTARTSIPDLDPNPGSYFGPALFENALSAQRNVARNKITKDYEGQLGFGFEEEFLPDTVDDPYIQRIVDEQYQDALTDLERAQSRGTLNETGFEDAMRGLSQAKSGATARAQGTGLGVIEKGRESLRDLDAEHRQRIADFDFGDNFDSRQAQGRIRGKANQFSLGLEGELRNALGDQRFFDSGSLITRGGKAQGMVNPGAALRDQMQEEELRRTQGDRGAF